MLGGELGNSTASSLAYLEPLWPQFVALNLNTILAPVYWDLIEPEEGRFDFSLVDGLIDQARSHGIRLVLLWFGSWKNCMSSYVPAWIKKEQRRFPRAQNRNGRSMEMLSAFHEANRDADARAFAALMRHIRETDHDHTVVMVQVENEIGMIPDARDFSDAANARYRAPVPERLMEYLDTHFETLAPEVKAAWERQGKRREGAWEEVFGKGLHTEELFMTWHYAVYVEHVTAAGKAEHPLPMYLNAALIRPGYKPGQYASAGPLPHLIDIWRAGAPSIDFLAPDIYFPNFVEWCRKYDVSGNPLFIPEAQRNAQNVANAFYAIGAHSAMGFCPFAIEAADEQVAPHLAHAYLILRQLSPLIVEHQGRGTMVGVAPDIAFDGSVRSEVEKVELGGYSLTVTFEAFSKSPHQPRGTEPVEPTAGGLVIQLGPDEFLVAGTGLTITFETDDPERSSAGILDIQEGSYADGRWTPGRWLNGDQSHQGRHLRIPPGQYGIQRLRLYRYV